MFTFIKLYMVICTNKSIQQKVLKHILLRLRTIMGYTICS